MIGIARTQQKTTRIGPRTRSRMGIPHRRLAWISRTPPLPARKSAAMLLFQMRDRHMRIDLRGLDELEWPSIS